MGNCVKQDVFMFGWDVSTCKITHTIQEIFVVATIDAPYHFCN